VRGGAFCEPAKREGAMPWRENSMVTNGERKTNNFGKLVRQKVGLFSKVGSARAVCAAGGAPVVVVRLPPSKMRAESNKGVRAGSEAMHSETRARKQATSTVPLSRVQPCQAEKRIN
jgi:hypothetical protein